MNNTNKVYVVTNCWDNGEHWGDNYHDEKPVKAFNSLISAKAYCESMGKEIESIPLYNHQVAKYGITKEKKYIECPIGENWSECEENYEEEYCMDCQRENWDVEYDYSFEQLRIYEVEMGETI